MPSSNSLKKVPTRSLSKQDELLNIQTQYFVKLEDLKLTRRQKCQRFLYDPETKKIFGRTAASWCEYFGSIFFLNFVRVNHEGGHVKIGTII
jgi:hypothetical protein